MPDNPIVKGRPHRRPRTGEANQRTIASPPRRRRASHGPERTGIRPGKCRRQKINNALFRFGDESIAEGLCLQLYDTGSQLPDEGDGHKCTCIILFHAKTALLS